MSKSKELLPCGDDRQLQAKYYFNGGFSDYALINREGIDALNSHDKLVAENGRLREAAGYAYVCLSAWEEIRKEQGLKNEATLIALEKLRKALEETKGEG